MPDVAVENPTRNGYRNSCCSPRHLCPAHREIAQHYKRKRKPFVYADKRIEEIEAAMHPRYGNVLPDDETGRRFVLVLANHMGEAKRIRIMLANYAPWYPEDDADELIRRVERRRTKWRADSLAQFLGVTYAERTKYGLRTIGTCDMPKEQRAKLRRESYRERERELGRLRQAKRRQANGAKPQAESASRTQPWLAAGYKCRSTWERHGKPVPQIRNAHTSSSKGERDEVSARRTQPVPRGNGTAVPVSGNCPSLVGSSLLVHGQPQAATLSRRRGGRETQAVSSRASGCSEYGAGRDLWQMLCRRVHGQEVRQ